MRKNEEQKCWEATLYLGPGDFIYHFNISGKPAFLDSQKTQISESGITNNVITV